MIPDCIRIAKRDCKMDTKSIRISSDFPFHGLEKVNLDEGFVFQGCEMANLSIGRAFQGHDLSHPLRGKNKTPS